MALCHLNLLHPLKKSFFLALVETPIYNASDELESFLVPTSMLAASSEFKGTSWDD